MKNTIKILYILAILSSVMIACSKDDGETIDQELEINYKNISGNWQLIKWNDQKLPLELHCYMKLDRLDSNFEIYQNINSMHSIKQTGEYEIKGNKHDEEYILTGVYHYTHQQWSEYIIKSLTQNSLILIKKENITDISIYSRIDEIPEKILEQ